MATETVDTTKPVGATNEYPDIVGTRPEDRRAASFQPYIPADREMPELTVRAIIVGTLLGMIFGASSLYLVLEGRADGERIDSGGGHLDHAVSHLLEVRGAQRDDS